MGSQILYSEIDNRYLRVAVRRDDGDVQHTASSHVCFPKSHGTTSKPASLESTKSQHIPTYTTNKTVIPTFFAHAKLSNLAPVTQKRLNHIWNGSSHAEILFANSGTKSLFNSMSVRVQTRAATSPPADVPVMTRGKSSASKNAFATPKWSASYALRQ